MDPLASIIIPTFNRAAMLPTAIDSALNQTLQCEVIVVDHGSSDTTPEVMQAYEGRVRYLRRDQDFGPHFCWLEGALSTTTPFVHFQYDDDWIEPEFMQACLDLIHEDVGFSFSVAQVVGTDGQKKMDLFQNWESLTGIYASRKFRRRVEKTLISPAACLFRRDVVLDALYQRQLPLQGPHYHGVGPDVFMSLLSLLRYPKVGYVAEPLAKFRSHEGSITISASADTRKQDALHAAYDNVRRYYRHLKLIKFLSRLGL